MLLIGSHVSFSKEQLLGCVKQALSYGANSFMLYTGAPQNTVRSAIIDEYTMAAYTLMKENNIALEHVFCHAPYIINLANNIDPQKYDFSIKFLKGEIKRCQTLGLKYLIVHPGSSLTLEKRVAIENIANALNLALADATAGFMILLETMGGKGSEVGAHIDELQAIIERVSSPEKIGICLDSCHLNDSGINLNEFDDYLNAFDAKIGLHKIKCLHLNDSKNEVGTNKDRHANIGYGTIGFDCLLKVIYHEKLAAVPKILETPYIDEKPPYQAEIAMIKAKTFNPNLINN